MIVIEYVYDMKIIYVYVSALIVASLLIPGSYAISGNSMQSDAMINPITPYLQTHVLITITNNQNVSTSANYNEMIVVNSSQYSLFESSNLSNVYFSYTNGTVIDSWLQSGNSFNDSNTTYWLKLEYPVISNARLTIEMNFLPRGDIAFNGFSTGEAPQLSKMYGQFDNGQNIFKFYDNFAGTTLNLSKWITSGTSGNGGGSAIVNNSLHLTSSHIIYTRENFTNPAFVESCGLIGPGTPNDTAYFLNGVGFSQGGYCCSGNSVSSGWATNSSNRPGMSLWNGNGATYTYNYSKSIEPNRFYVYGVGYVLDNYTLGIVNGQVENSSHVGFSSSVHNLNATIGFQDGDYSPNNTFYWVFVRNTTPSGIINLPYSVVSGGYSVKFVPRGLPTDLSWNASINGINLNSNGGTNITSMLVNGSYQANFTASGGYQPYPVSTHFTISGRTYTFLVLFESPANQTFLRAISTFSTRTMQKTPGYVNNFTYGNNTNCISSVAFDQGQGTLFASLPNHNEIIRYNASSGVVSGKNINVTSPDSLYYSSQSNLLYSVSSSTGNLSLIYSGNGTIEKNIYLPNARNNVTYTTGVSNSNELYVISGNYATSTMDVYILYLNGSILKNTTFRQIPAFAFFLTNPEIYNGNILMINSTGVMNMNPMNGSFKYTPYPKGFQVTTITPYGVNGLFLVGNGNLSGVPDLIYNATTYGISGGIAVDGVPFTSAYSNLTGIEYIQSFNTTTCTPYVVALKVSTGKILATAPYGTLSMHMLFDSSSRTLIMTNSLFFGSSVSHFIYTYSTSSIYSVTFRESGLAPGTTWNLKINGVNEIATGSEYTVSGDNGTSFAYSISNSTYYYTTGVTSGTVVINGSDVVVNLNYHHWAYITGKFTQKGLNVTVNGVVFSVGNSTFNMSVVAGSYTVVISDPGYVTKYMNFTLSSGGTENITTTLNKISGPPTPVFYYYAAAGIVVVIAAAVGYFYIRRK